MRKLFQFLFLAILGGSMILFTSCDDDGNGGGGTPEDPTITITNDAQEGFVGETVTFNFVTSVDPGATVTGIVANDGSGDVAVTNAASYDYVIPESARNTTVTITFTITDSEGRTGTDDATIEVSRFTRITDDDLVGGQTYNFQASTEYLLDGLVYLEAGSTLNIQEGTVIRFKAVPTGADNTSSLIITTGAQINATGTAANPIIFTAEVDELDGVLGSTDVTLWGGLIVLGLAPLEEDGSGTSQIEGIDPTEPRGEFGGTNPGDNSGTITYCSIRHSGVALDGTAGNEIQGLTLGGVGNGTTIDFVEIFASFDDGIEFFGGTVIVNHAVIAFAQDDSFDWDIGYRGGGQYWFAVQEGGAGHGGEWDGAKPDDATLFSDAQVWNATFIGPGTGNTTLAILMRDGTGGTVGNSIITNYAGRAIEVEDRETAVGTDAYSRIDNELFLRSNTWNVASGTTAADIISVTVDDNDNPIGDDPTGTTLINHLTNNNNVFNVDPQLGGVDATAGSGGLDPRPAAATQGQPLATVPGGFETVNYVGAFEPGAALWIKGWTALDEKGYLP